MNESNESSVSHFYTNEIQVALIVLFRIGHKTLRQNK